MSTAGISFGGLASGLDTKAIISALMAIEQRPITALETKKTDLSKRKSLFGDLKGLLDKVKDAAKAIKTTQDFLSMKAVSDNEDILTASASSSATPGTYSVKVMQLAKAQINHTSGAASATTPTSQAPIEFVIDVGGEQVAVATNDSSLQGIANAINNAGVAVAAEVVDTGNSTNPYQLVVRATETGAINGFTISEPIGDQGFLNLITDLTTPTNQQNAQDSQIQLNGGVTIKRPTNQVANAIGGVTLDLKSFDQNTEVTVTISTDAEEIGKKVQELVDAYNKVVDFVTAQNAIDAEGKAQNPLFGDSTLGSIRSSLRSVMSAVVEDTGNEAYQMLVQLGITGDRNGKLTLNKGKLEEALADDEGAVAKLFTNATSGLAARLEAQIEVYTDTVDGLIKTRQDGFDRVIKQTTNRIDQANRRLTQYQKQLETKYANLETLLGRLQSQGSSLNSIGR